jgi:DNA-binding protein HU-beta
LVRAYILTQVEKEGTAMATKRSAKPMTKSELVSLLAEKTCMAKKQAVEILAVLAETAYEEAKKGFTIPGVGKLVVAKRKARMGRNPKTGEPISIPAKTVLKFRIAKACKDAVLRKK